MGPIFKQTQNILMDHKFGLDPLGDNFCQESFLWMEKSQFITLGLFWLRKYSKGQKERFKNENENTIFIKHSIKL